VRSVDEARGAVAVLDVAADAIPAAVSGLGRYFEALVLVRRRGRPVGQVRLSVRDGRLAGDELRRAVVQLIESAPAASPVATQPGAQARPLTAAVAVCTRDRPVDLARCLEAIAGLSDEGHEVLVVDSASSTDETRRACDGYPGVRCLREDRPGLDVARNRAIREARGDVVAFCDDDAAPDPGWLRALLAGFQDPAVACVTGLTMPLELETAAQQWFERVSPFGRGFVRRVFDPATLDPLAAGRAGGGTNMAFRRSVFEAVGPFDEALDAGTPTRSGGDTEMFSRVLTAGFRIVYEPAALCWHRHRRTWPELRETLYGYGVGVYAFWTRRLLVEREVRVVRLAGEWLFRHQLPALGRSLLRRPGATPADLLLAELKGCAAGPWAYLRSSRRVRQGARRP
jgi:GT2 family glycosyltransferase